MGSASSTSVSPVKGSCSSVSSVVPESHQRKAKHKSKDQSITASRENSVASLSADKTDGHISHPENEPIAELEKQIGQLESEKLDLQDQVSAFEEQLNLLAEKQEPNGDDNECLNTIKAKDQYIEQLFSENEAMKLQLNKLRKHYKRRLRLLNVQMTEVKHQTSLETMELKEEIKRLRDDKIKSTKGDISRTEEVSAEQSRGKNSIILALSAKVTEQEAVIADLQKASAAGETELTFSDTRDTSDRVRQTNYTGHKVRTYGIDSTPDDLVSIMNEIKVHQKGSKQKKKKSYPSDVKDKRQSSGVSRDSRIVSLETVSEEETMNSKSRSDRVSPATSGTSQYSYLDSEDDEKNDGHTPSDLGSIRRISAYKSKIRHNAQISQLEHLLHDVNLNSVPLSVPIGKAF